MRLHQIAPEYEGRVRVRVRPFPLELLGGEAAPRDILEQEWWLAALQEPQAPFARYPGDDWPITTVPAFEAVWAAARQGETAAEQLDLRIRRAFFSEGRNIGRRDVLVELARDLVLDAQAFERAFAHPDAHAAVVAEAREGRQRFQVRRTPTLMLGDGMHLPASIALPTIQRRKIVAVAPLPCSGEGCLDQTRALFEQALGAPASSAK